MSKILIHRLSRHRHLSCLKDEQKSWFQIIENTTVRRIYQGVYERHSGFISKRYCDIILCSDKTKSANIQTLIAFKKNALRQPSSCLFGDAMKSLLQNLRSFSHNLNFWSSDSFYLFFPSANDITDTGVEYWHGF